LKFIRMVLNGGNSPGGRILKSETLEEMKRNQLGEMNVPSLKSIDKALPTGRPAGSLMWACLTNCYYWIDPASGIGGVMLSQILPFADVKAMPLYYAFEYTVYANR